MSRTVWITGAGGALGHALLTCLRINRRTDRLVAMGRGLDHVPKWSPAQNGLIAAACGTLGPEIYRDCASLHGLPDLVFHLAGRASVRGSLKAPLRDFHDGLGTTADLLYWLGRFAPEARVVLASSAAVYGNAHRTAIRETAAPEPVAPYGWHKKMAEDLAASVAQTTGLRILPVRIFSLFGERLRKQLFWDLLQACRTRPRTIALMGSGEECRDWVHLEDAAAILMQFAETEALFEPAPRAINLGSGQALTVRAAASRFVAALTEGDDHLPGLMFSGFASPADPAYLVADVSRTLRAGITPPPPAADRIAQTARCYRQTCLA